MFFFKKSPDSFADQVGERPKLLSGEWSSCAHKTGFWYGKAESVSDESGEYVRLSGDCKKCNQPVFVIHEKAVEPT